ncbi:MAG: hypothetical protein ABJ370_23015 [Paracoccaceae bacterium]
MPLFKLILKGAMVAIGATALLLTACLGLFLDVYHLAQVKYDQIPKGDLRVDVDDRRGLLFARQVDPTFMGGYRFVDPFKGLIANPNNTILGYTLFGAGFTVIYDKDGKVLIKIDNLLDG